MPRIDGEIVIAAPVEQVLDMVADERNEPRYNPRIARAEKASPVPTPVLAQSRPLSRSRQPQDSAGRPSPSFRGRRRPCVPSPQPNERPTLLDMQMIVSLDRS